MVILKSPIHILTNRSPVISYIISSICTLARSLAFQSFLCNCVAIHERLMLPNSEGHENVLAIRHLVPPLLIHIEALEYIHQPVKENAPLDEVAVLSAL